uniref:RING finger and CHY zinc finger domain-containing protein 1-like n=1 Tax=Styela clava TaxID=7725 RepID=UPI0019399E4F|nr:RING finger and CHY zinc finger domain-containing protein 1-like [Styela clava]
MECEHYKNNCVLICPNMKCRKWFPCNKCHDAWVDDHQMDRYIVQRLKCNICFTQQFVSTKCISCGIVFGKYYCDICHVYDDRNLDYFHCYDCGFCRTGGQRNHKHCDKCNTCVPLALVRTHNCVENSANSSCPICMNDITPTYEAFLTMACGHSMHTNCYEELLQKASRPSCPTCRKQI